MERPVVIRFPKEWSLKPGNPQTETSEIREMFREISQRYAVYQQPPTYFRIKRLTDIVISMLFITLVMTWLLPVVALLIKLTSRGPVLFIQKRTGYKGVEFDCFKFRTMHLNDDAHTVQAKANDKRITFIGKILRLTHLDETPQLFNVLLGEMSIVGPRPHMIYHTRHYSRMFPYYNLRHEAVPGMTGMAQIKGFLGEITIERDLRKRIQWDIYYLKNRSTWLDIRIVFITILQVFKKSFAGITGKKRKI